MVWTGGAQGTLAPALVALFEQADRGWPRRSRISDGTIGDQAHASRTSDHNPKRPNPPGWVDAGDLTEDHTRGPSLPRLWSHLISKRDPRVKYLIYEGRIVKSYVDLAGRPAWVPQPYNGPNAHAHHLHVSVTPAGRHDTSPWFPPSPFINTEDDMTPEEHKALFDVRDMLAGATAYGFPGFAEMFVAGTRPGETGGGGIVAMLRSLVIASRADKVNETEVARQVVAALGTTELARAIADAGITEAVKQALREGTGS